MTHIDGWRMTTLGEECEIVSGSTPKTGERSFWDGDIPWLTPADLSKWRGTYIDGGSRYITKKGLDSCSARLFPRNTVMMSSRAPIGYTAIANREMCTNQGFKSMLPSETVDPEWLRYFLEHALPEIKSMSSGTTFAEISGKKLATLPMNLPPLDEQKRIVEALDDHLSRLDKALAEVARAKLLVKMFAPSFLHKMISDDSFESRRMLFKDFITLQRGFDLPKQDRKSGLVPIVGSNGVLGFHDEAKVIGPGVVTGRSGTIGRVHYIENDFWALNTTLYVKDFKGNHPLFVYEYLQTLDLKHFAGGSTVPSLDRNVLNDIEVEVPTFKRQIEISREMAIHRDSMLDVLSRVSLLDYQFHQLRKSALNAAFNGTLTKELR